MPATRRASAWHRAPRRGQPADRARRRRQRPRGAPPRTRDRLPPGPPLPLPLQSLLAWNRPSRSSPPAGAATGRCSRSARCPGAAPSSSTTPSSSSRSSPATRPCTTPARATRCSRPCSASARCWCSTRTQHLQARKRLLPPFHGESVRRYGEVVERIVAEEAARWPLGTPFPLHPRMRAITLEVILQAVIGVTDPVRLRALREVLPATVEINPMIMAMWVVPALERVGPLAALPAHASPRPTGCCARRSPRAGSIPTWREREDVLSQLVRAGEIDDEELRDQIMTLLLAGHETTTTGPGVGVRAPAAPPRRARARARGRGLLPRRGRAGDAAHPPGDPGRAASAAGAGRARRLAAAGRRDRDARDHADARRPRAVPASPSASAPSASSRTARRRPTPGSRSAAGAGAASAPRSRASRCGSRCARSSQRTTLRADRPATSACATTTSRSSRPAARA